MRDQLFSSSRNVLPAKRRRLKSEGKGNKPNRSSTITDEMVQNLLKTEELFLFLFLFLFHDKLFGLMGSHESRQATWSSKSMRMG